MTSLAESSTAAAWPFPRIRPGLASEVEPLMVMCRKMHDEGGIGGPLDSMDEVLVRDEIMRGLSRNAAFIGVIGEPGKIEGSICLVLSRLWYKNLWWLEDKWNFVLPEHRKSNNTRELLRFAKWLAAETGAPLMMSILSNKRTEAKIRLYRREFGEPAGAFFLYGATTGQH